MQVPMLLQLLFFQEKNKKPLRKQLKNEVPLSNVPTLKKLSCQQLTQYTKAKHWKLQESISVKEVF